MLRAPTCHQAETQPKNSHQGQPTLCAIDKPPCPRSLPVIQYHFLDKERLSFAFSCPFIIGACGCMPNAPAANAPECVFRIPYCVFRALRAESMRTSGFVVSASALNSNYGGACHGCARSFAVPSLCSGQSCSEASGGKGFFPYAYRLSSLSSHAQALFTTENTELTEA